MVSLSDKSMPLSVSSSKGSNGDFVTFFVVVVSMFGVYFGEMNTRSDKSVVDIGKPNETDALCNMQNPTRVGGAGRRKENENSQIYKFEFISAYYVHESRARTTFGWMFGAKNNKTRGML